MQDELFARNVNCVLIIKEGFSLDVVTIPGTQAATTFESAINSFTKHTIPTSLPATLKLML